MKAMTTHSILWKDLPPSIGHWEARPKIVDYLLSHIDEMRQTTLERGVSAVEFPRYRVTKAAIKSYQSIDVKKYWKGIIKKRQMEQLPPDLPPYAWLVAREGYSEFKAYYQRLRPFSLQIILQATVSRLLGDSRGYDQLVESAEEFADWCESDDFCLWVGDYDLLESVENYAHFLDMFSGQLPENKRTSILDGIEAGARKSREILDIYKLAECRLDSHVVHQSFTYANLCTTLASHGREAGRDGLRYLSRIYRTAWPFFGYSDGGWGMGIAYWQWQLCSIINGAEAIRDLGYIDLTATPFMKRTGDFKWMVHAPYFRTGCFGDSSDLKPTVLDYALMGLLGKIYNNNFYSSYVDGFEPQIKPDYNSGPDSAPIHALLLLCKTWRRPYGNSLQARAGGKRSFAFVDTGITSTHTALGEPEKDFVLNFRSSQWGSYGHAHADQNSFVVQAFGEPLFIDAGYYPSFHSAHMKGFSIQTEAHNSLLINGRGQTPRNINSRGKIEQFKSDANFDYVVGECSGAYDENVKLCRRHILIRKDVENPWFLVADRVQLVQPGNVDFLLHSYEEPVFNPASHEALFKGWKVYGGNAKCLVKWIEPSQLYWTQTDRFPYPADDRESNKPNQWHGRMTTANPQKDHLLLTAFIFYRQPASSTVFSRQQRIKLPKISYREDKELRLIKIGGTQCTYSMATDSMVGIAR